MWGKFLMDFTFWGNASTNFRERFAMKAGTICWIRSAIVVKEKEGEFRQHCTVLTVEDETSGSLIVLPDDAVGKLFKEVPESVAESASYTNQAVKVPLPASLCLKP